MKNSNILHFGITSLILLIWESIIQSISNFSFSEVISFAHPLIAFGGLAFGNVLGLVLHKKISPPSWSIFLTWSIGISWMGISHVPDLGIVWLILPFIGMGALFYDFFSNLSLKALIIFIALLGSLYFVFITITGGFSNDILLLVLILLSSGLSLTLNSGWKILIILIFGLSPVFLKIGEKLEITSFMERAQAFSYEGAVTIGDPEINLLFRTEALWLPNLARPILLYNGSRFAMLKNIIPTTRDFNSNSESRTKIWPVYVAPYLLNTYPKNVLVIGSAEGENVAAAVFQKSVDSVKAVDINPAVFVFLKEKYPYLSNNIYNHPKVTTIRSEGRVFLEKNTEQFDLITLQGVQTGTQGSSVSSALLESYLLTEEALAKIWDSLSPSGVVYIDEYTSKYGENKSIVAIIANLAKKKFGLRDSQIVYYSYSIETLQNTNSILNSKKMREGLLLSKLPIPSVEMARDRLSEYKINHLTHLKLDTDSVSHLKLPKDDHPFFIQNIGNTFSFLFIIIIFILLTGFSHLLLRQSGLKFVGKNKGLFFLGASYIVLIMAFSGPLTLISGEPFLSGVLTYISLYVFGLAAGLAAFKIKKISYRILASTSGFILIGSWLSMDITKNYFLALDSQLFRLGFVIICMAIIAIIFEIPYIYYLKNVHGEDRGALYTYENMGTLVGSLISLPSQIVFGFTGTFIVGVFMFICSWIYLKNE
ncbi:MAG: hypothetical protein A2622_04670 [Bdellovibrionales bacterium RIFCSPHIGHO2_01_FULL_40_29]|nr:MAG: hypothetical protein A2622_04670 [Bdellovibrionales bacterium RIFCSPHIGHO2_01_FULL_40_29]OFZ34773.1 MAG: hypothetical protein A3D17_10705 [Bdellovibrionales bacterium RIFCSPHIGHO2_02_FULL_40_15]